MNIEFKTAERTRNRLKMALDGPAGSGKTYTALRLAHSLGKNVFVIDTQYGAASLYAGEEVDGKIWNFQHIILSQYDVDIYRQAIQKAEESGADVIVIDSLSSAWDDCGGILDQVDRKAEQRGSDGKLTGTFTAWQKGSMLYKSLIKHILESPCHIIATIRTKNDYLIEKDEKGKTHIRKIGVKLVQREGIEYEFDLGMSLDCHHIATVTKTHCSVFPMDAEIQNPGKETAEQILEWLQGKRTRPESPVTIPSEAKKEVPETAAPTAEEKPSTENVETQNEDADAKTVTAEELAAMKKHIREAIGTTITPQEYWEWRGQYKIRKEESLTDFHTMVLYGDIQVKEQTGEWRPAPF